MNKFLIPLLLSIFFLPKVQADYPAARLNQHVCEEIKDQKDRLIPRKDWACVAVDGEAYARGLGNKDFYHGVGHWTQVRTEISPNEWVALNFRSIFYAGSSSQGYATPTDNYHLASFKFTYPESILGGRVSLRAVDLDRQTVGAGLLVQERESNGGIFLWDFEDSQFMFRQESTGYLVLDDDVSNPEIRFWKKRLGIGGLFFYKQDYTDQLRDPYYYLFTQLPLWSFDIDAEAGLRNNIAAGLLRVKRNFFLGPVGLEAAIEGRTYGNGFAQGFEGQIEHQYISYDQYNKAYTNSMNIFVNDDHVDVYAAFINLRYEWNHFHRFGFFNELSNFAYRTLPEEKKYFFRLEYDYFPFISREDHFAFFVSNKVLTLSYYRPPRDVSWENMPLFFEYTHVGIEGRFRF